MKTFKIILRYFMAFTMFGLGAILIYLGGWPFGSVCIILALMLI